MAFSAWLITVLTLALLLAWRWGWLRLPVGLGLASAPGEHARHAGVLTDGLGLAQLALPAGWRAATGLNEEAAIQALAPLRRRYLVVISESRVDFTPGFSLEQHARRTMAALGEGIRVIRTNGPQRGQLGPYECLQFEIEAYSDHTAVTYLHTTIAGRRAFHQVLGWAVRSLYDRGAFEAVLNGFSELPGEDPEPRALPPLVARPPASKYRVH